MNYEIINENPKTIENIKIFRKDWLLIIGAVLAPMTGFRIGKVGPAELLCLIWGVKFLFQKKHLFSFTHKFFLCFLISMVLGTVVGLVVAPRELDIGGLVTWIYLCLISISIYEGLLKNTYEYNEKLLYIFAVTATIWNMFLFLFSKTVSMRFLGAPLWYANARYSGGGKNPHQVAVLLCGLCFIFVRVIIKGSLKSRLMNTLGFIICFFLLIQTASSTGIMSVMIGLGITLFFSVGELFPNNKMLGYSITIVIILVVAIFFASFFYESFMNWVEADPNGTGRIDIFSSYPETFIKSPIFGLGPGIHGLNGRIEYHNTYIEILAATGLMGGFIFLLYTEKLIKQAIMSDWTFIPIIVSVYSYGFAGFAMRRLVYWVIIVFVTVISEQMVAEQNRIDKTKK